MTQLTQVKRIVGSSLIVISSALLVACGGGGGGGETTTVVDTTEPTPEPVTTTPPVQEIPETEPSPEPVATSLEDVQVAESFSFSNQQDFAVSVDYPFQKSERAYLNICTQWKDLDSNSVEYSSCVWRGQINQAQMQVSFTLPAHASTLVAEVWQISSGNLTRVHQALNLAELGSSTATFSF